MYDDDEFDVRNAVLRRPVQVARTVPAPAYRPSIQVGGGYGAPMYPGYPAPYPAPYAPPYAASAYPWQQPVPPTSPLVDKFTGSLKLGMVLEIAAQALAAMASLPTAPQMTESTISNAQNQVKYQEALAQHAKRDEQFRTLGALARLFLV
jgi:hypothetical protein